MAAMISGLSLGDADETHLAGRLAHGESGAFEQLVRVYQPRVARLAYRLLGWRGDIDDVVQEVFLAVLRKADRFRQDSSLWTWLTMITLNHCRTHQRKQMLKSRVYGVLSRLAPGRSPASDASVIRDEAARQVRRAVAALPPRDREVIVLHYLEHRATAQIGQLLGISANAVEVRLYRARRKLREALQSLRKD